MRILVVEDDKVLQETLCAYLSEHGYEAIGAGSADAAYAALEESKFDLLLSDIMMPGTSGIAFTREVRMTDKDIPIFLMTAREDFETKELGFRAGCDDYMTKPLDLPELLLRISALFRRAKIREDKRLTVGALTLDREEHAAYLDGDELTLTVREFDILYKLLSYPKKTFTRAALMDEFWGYDTPSGPRTVDVYMTKIREKLSACRDFEIQTVHGLGYKAVLK